MAREDIAKEGEATRFTSEKQPKQRRSRKGVPNRTTILKKWTGVKVEIGAEENPTGAAVKGKVEDEIMLALINKAREGDVSAIREILDTLYGKVKERHETSQSNFDYNEADLSILNAYELERIIAGDDPRPVFAAARARRIREAAQAVGSSDENAG